MLYYGSVKSDTLDLEQKSSELQSRVRLLVFDAC